MITSLSSVATNWIYQDTTVTTHFRSCISIDCARLVCDTSCCPRRGASGVRPPLADIFPLKADFPLVSSTSSSYLGTDAGSADDGEQRVSFGTDGDLHPREPLGELHLILLCRTHSIHEHLRGLKNMSNNKKNKNRHVIAASSPDLRSVIQVLYLFELHPTVQGVLHQTNSSIMWQRVQIVFYSEYKHNGLKSSLTVITSLRMHAV